MELCATSYHDNESMWFHLTVYVEKGPGAFELWIPGGIGFPMDYAAVTPHKNEHVFMCISERLLSLFTSLNNNLDFYIYFLPNCIKLACMLVYIAYLIAFAEIKEECGIL